MSYTLPMCKDEFSVALLYVLKKKFGIDINEIIKERNAALVVVEKNTKIISSLVNQNNEYSSRIRELENVIKINKRNYDKYVVNSNKLLCDVTKDLKKVQSDLDNLSKKTK